MESGSQPQDLTTLRRVVHVLDTLGIAYVLGGSVASSLHGVARPTQDFDLAVALAEGMVGAFVAELGEEFYADEGSIREAITRGGSANLIHHLNLDKVDLFTRDTPRERAEMARAVTMELEPGWSVRVLSPEDVVIRKLDWFRQGGGISDRQWRDVLGVLKVQGARFNRALARELAQALGLGALLERALDEAGPATW